MRPSLPVPAMRVGSRLFSATTRWGGGRAGWAWPPARTPPSGCAGSAGSGVTPEMEVGSRPPSALRRPWRAVGGRRSRGRRGGRLGAAGAPAGAHAAKQGAGLDGVAFGGGDVAEHAILRRHDFQGDLVGLQLHQNLVLAHSVAGLLGPAGDGGLGDRFTQRRGHDVGHVGLPGGAKASVRKAFSSLVWRLISPAAVDAEAGRPT